MEGGVVQVAFGWIPGAGNAINTATAAGLTEAIGWAAADQFYNQSLDNVIQYSYDGEVNGFKDASEIYEKKLRDQAKHFLTQKKVLEEEREELNSIINEYEIYILENLSSKTVTVNHMQDEIKILKNIREASRGGNYMSVLEELSERRRKSNERADKAVQNMDMIINESERVADVAHNASEILDNLDRDFELKTGLQGTDIVFLFIAIGLQCVRIYILNELTKREKATKIRNEDGSLTLEGKIDKKEQELLSKYSNGISEEPHDFYAPLSQIIANPKVPYDCTELSERGTDFFQHANHRFATLGHDPLLGIVFGTANILTNTISITKAPIPGIFTELVEYKVTPMKKGGLKIGSPVIQFSGVNPVQLMNTVLMLNACEERIKNDKKAVSAALIKQLCHIGTDMFTKAGLQIPGSNLILSASQVEELTRFIDSGTVVKAGAGAGFAVLVNSLISFAWSALF